MRLEPGTTKNAEGRTFPWEDVLPELRDLITAQGTETKRVEHARGIIVPWVFHGNGRDFELL